MDHKTQKGKKEKNNYTKIWLHDIIANEIRAKKISASGILYDTFYCHKSGRRNVRFVDFALMAQKSVIRGECYKIDNIGFTLMSLFFALMSYTQRF